MIDIFGYQNLPNNCVACSIRVRADGTSDQLAKLSSHDDVLFKRDDLTSGTITAGSVHWQKPPDDTSGPEFMTALFQRSLTFEDASQTRYCFQLRR